MNRYETMLAQVHDYADAPEQRAPRAELSDKFQKLNKDALAFGPDVADKVYQWSARRFTILHTTPRREALPGIIEWEINRELDGLIRPRADVERTLRAMNAGSAQGAGPPTLNPTEEAIADALKLAGHRLKGETLGYKAVGDFNGNTKTALATGGSSCGGRRGRRTSGERRSLLP
jgi:hypothetical protein